MKVSTAERMGWVVRNPDGTFSDAPTGTANPQDGNPEEGAPQVPEADDSNSLHVDTEMAEGIVDLSQALESVGGNRDVEFHLVV